MKSITGNEACMTQASNIVSSWMAYQPSYDAYSVLGITNTNFGLTANCNEVAEHKPAHLFQEVEYDFLKRERPTLENDEINS
jgi:hypothetical protein